MSVADTFKRCGLSPSVSQIALAKSIMGEPLDGRGELEAYLEYTGRSEYHRQRGRRMHRDLRS